MSTFFSRSGGSPPRKRPAKRLFVGAAGSPASHVDTKLENQNLDAEKAREQDRALADAEARARDKHDSKYESKRRNEKLLRKLLDFAKQFRADLSETGRRKFVKQILETNPTAWDVNRFIEAFRQTETSDGIYLSALTNPDGSPVTKRPAKESHRHPAFTQKEEAFGVREAQEASLSGEGLELSDTQVFQILARCQNILSYATVDNLPDGSVRIAAAQEDAAFVPFIEKYYLLFAANAPDVAKADVLADILSEAVEVFDSSEAEKEAGRRRRVRTEGTPPDNDEVITSIGSSPPTKYSGGALKPVDEAIPFEVKISAETKENLRETSLGKAIRAAGQKKLQTEGFLREAQRHNRDFVFPAKACPATTKENDIVYWCVLSCPHKSQHAAARADGSALRWNLVKPFSTEKPEQVPTSQQDSGDSV